MPVHIGRQVWLYDFNGYVGFTYRIDAVDLMPRMVIPDQRRKLTQYLVSNKPTCPELLSFSVRIVPPPASTTSQLFVDSLVSKPGRKECKTLLVVSVGLFYVGSLEKDHRNVPRARLHGL